MNEIIAFFVGLVCGLAIAQMYLVRAYRSVREARRESYDTVARVARERQELVARHIADNDARDKVVNALREQNGHLATQVKDLKRAYDARLTRRKKP